MKFSTAKNYFKAKTVYGDPSISSESTMFPLDVETLVIGGGLLGVSTAYSLAKNNHDVVVIDSGILGEGASGRSGGQLWPGFEESFSCLEKQYGDDTALLLWKYTDGALTEIHRKISSVDDMCDFTPGLILVSKDEQQEDFILKEYSILKKRGIEYAEYLSKEEIKKKYIATDYYNNGIMFTGKKGGAQYGHINPFKYLQATVSLAKKAGVRFVEHCRADEVIISHDSKHTIKTTQGIIRAHTIVFAAGATFSRPKGINFNLLPRMYLPVQTVILATEPISELLALEMISSRACFCDASDTAMNYVALIKDSQQRGKYRLTFGGADALVQAQITFELIKLEREMRTIFPQLDREGIKVERVWGGVCDLTRSSLPYILNPTERIFAAGGFSGQGMVHTELYGRAIAEKILGIDHTKFETLKRVNPKSLSRITCIAWLQIMRKFI